jgi:hypothetical protein
MYGSLVSGHGEWVSGLGLSLIGLYVRLHVWEFGKWSW